VTELQENLAMLIFNADDFLLTQADTERVLQLRPETSVIRSTSAVANGNKLNSLDTIPEHLTIGLHVNLTEGKALTSEFSNNGWLPNKRLLYRKLLTNSITSESVYNEISAQHRQLVDMGINVSHIDTHQNIHLLPNIRTVIHKISTELQLPVRGLKTSNLTRVNKFNNFLRNQVIKLGPQTNNEIVLTHLPGFGYQCTWTDAFTIWADLLQRLDPNQIYIIPAHLCISKFEFELYNSVEFLDIINASGHRIGNYNE
jgi:predicted glycoside hydrolase/deacetylase ChbG (UPF0249 family)